VAALSGCGGAADSPVKGPVREKKEEKKVPLEANGRNGVLAGKVVYDGDPPEMEPIVKMLNHPDKENCLKGTPAETHTQTWFVHKENKGVANVVVWLEPPKGTFFTLTEKEKDLKGEQIVIDQPHCVFIPHVVSLFPAYYDGAKYVATGQKLVFKNSARFPHALQWDSTIENPAFNQTIPAGDKLEVALHTQKGPLAIGCGFHSWMLGFAWIFDHPYHAVTRADGSFHVENVPTGVELTFKAWHESRREPFEQRKITFHGADKGSLDLKIK
jgi:hypothetical protein